MTPDFWSVAFVAAVAFACGLVLGAAVGMTLIPRRLGASTNEEN